MAKDTFVGRVGSETSTLYPRRNGLFSDGDQPTEAIFNDDIKQAAYGFDSLSAALGDIWGAGDITGRPSCLNLGKAIGDLGFLNSLAPWETGTANTFLVEETFSAIALNNKGVLETIYPITSVKSAKKSDSTTHECMAGILNTTSLANLMSSGVTGDFYISSRNGVNGNIIYLYRPLSSDDDSLTLRYYTNGSLHNPQHNSTTLIPNLGHVIYHKGETNYFCTLTHISVATDGYREYRLQFPNYLASILRIPGTAESVANPEYDQFSKLTYPVTTTTGEFRKHKLPKWFTSDINTSESSSLIAGLELSIGNIIPANLLMLLTCSSAGVVRPAMWSTQQSTADASSRQLFGSDYIQYIYTSESEIKIRVPDEGYISDASGNNVTATNSNEFALLVTNGGISSSLGSLNGLHHTSDGDRRLGGKGYSHENIVDSFLVQKAPFPPSNSNRYYNSGIPGNLHPQYLERRGYSSSDPLNFGNALLGDFVIAAKHTFTNLPVLSTSLPSYKLQFGSNLGPYIIGGGSGKGIEIYPVYGDLNAISMKNEAGVTIVETSDIVCDNIRGGGVGSIEIYPAHGGNAISMENNATITRIKTDEIYKDETSDKEWHVDVNGDTKLRKLNSIPNHNGSIYNGAQCIDPTGVSGFEGTPGDSPILMTQAVYAGNPGIGTTSTTIDTARFYGQDNTFLSGTYKLRLVVASLCWAGGTFDYGSVSWDGTEVAPGTNLTINWTNVVPDANMYLIIYTTWIMCDAIHGNFLTIEDIKTDWDS